ncbi:hypothetical protein LEM8419_00260 [Neolewinella maritima]|uniref:Sulfotransferase n=1 Tax=Neolewinella maritima TaxID=1383882 RepID=A0ABN8F4W0_9BACT|nr:sulfotransferase [Neolewinella maritima]CAH0998965.1 hypothetical protein LEM8419_00260 [Neolewinella maritima]
MQQKKVVLVTGTGHCGSTLVDLILSSHSSSLGVGELIDVRNKEGYARGTLVPNELYGFDDSLWTPQRLRYVYQQFVKERSFWHRVLGKVAPMMQSNRTKIYASILDAVPKKRLLVDSSKSVPYTKTSLLQLKASEAFEPYLIWIKRDPRGVINSYRRKYPEIPVATFIEKFKRAEREIRQIHDTLGVKKMIVDYGQLAGYPEAETRRLCDFCGLDFEADMLEFWKHEHHHIAGNSGTKTLVAKYHNAIDAYTTNEGSKEFYAQHGFAIKADVRWQSEMRGDDLGEVIEAFDLEPITK